MMREHRPNIRPVRGITADTVRALIGLRHAGSDCSYLPLERYQLADQVKGSVPPQCIDPADVPATLRDDCDSYPAKPILMGFDRAREGSDRTVVSIRGKSGTVIIDEFFETPSVAQPIPSAGCDDAARSAPLAPEPTAPSPAPIDRACAKRADGPSKEDEIYAAAVAKERCARREDDRAERDGADQSGRSAGIEGINGTPRRVSRPARPADAARIAAANAERNADDPELKRSRADIIREIALKLAIERNPDARPLPGARIQRDAARTTAPDFIANRQAMLARAVAYLKARCILVDVTDRTAAIRKYRVSGKHESMLTEQVIQYAVSLGMEPAHP